ncbi:hypothetical protein V6U77_18595 [Micromonospora sp. CPCC 205546]|uniref:hypothetical protein n=1 Tax=Micromonospora sp. CPCC 205546 TaxID=3122397 RepID=UPI002FEF2B52
MAALPEGVDEAALVAAAARRAVRLHAMRRYRVDGTGGPPAIVLGSGGLGAHAIRSGIARVADLLQARLD